MISRVIVRSIIRRVVKGKMLSRINCGLSEKAALVNALLQRLRGHIGANLLRIAVSGRALASVGKSDRRDRGLAELALTTVHWCWGWRWRRWDLVRVLRDGLFVR